MIKDICICSIIKGEVKKIYSTIIFIEPALNQSVGAILIFISCELSLTEVDVGSRFLLHLVVVVLGYLIRN